MPRNCESRSLLSSVDRRERAAWVGSFNESGETVLPRLVRRGGRSAPRGGGWRAVTRFATGSRRSRKAHLQPTTALRLAGARQRRQSKPRRDLHLKSTGQNDDAKT